MPSAPTQTLADRWQLIQFLGEGAMGEVWHGRHAMLGHEAAIKLMRAEAATDEELVLRFKREARIAAQLRHRNLVRVEDFGTSADGRPFLVMELLRGESLGALMERLHRLDRASAARITLHIAAACDAAHAAGIVHRDLKPDNCFVVTDDDGAPLVKVLDFGIAKVTDGMFKTSAGVLTGSHAVLGTPMYMSPEQARGQADLDGRSDLWSLAIIAYEMLTGRLPYTADNITQLLYAVLAAPIPPPTTFDPMLGPNVDAWFSRALDRDRSHRFQSGREFAHSFAAALGVAVGPMSLTPPSLPADHVMPISSIAPTAALGVSYPPRATPPQMPASTLMTAVTGEMNGFETRRFANPPRPVSVPPPGYGDALAATAYAPPRVPSMAPGAMIPPVAGSPHTPTVARTQEMAIPPGGYVPGASGFGPVPHMAQAMSYGAPPPRTSRLGMLMLAVGILAGMLVTASIVLATRRANHRRAIERANAEAMRPVAPMPPVFAPTIAAPIAPIAPTIAVPPPVPHNVPTTLHPIGTVGTLSHATGSHPSEPAPTITPHSTNAPGPRDPSVHEGFQAPHPHGAPTDGVDPHEL